MGDFTVEVVLVDEISDVVGSMVGARRRHRSGCLVTNRKEFAMVVAQLMGRSRGLALLGRLQGLRAAGKEELVSVGMLPEVWGCDSRTAQSVLRQLAAVGVIENRDGVACVVPSLSERQSGFLCTHRDSWWTACEWVGEAARTLPGRRVSVWTAMGALELLRFRLAFRQMETAVITTTREELSREWETHRETIRLVFRVLCTAGLLCVTGKELSLPLARSLEGDLAAPSLCPTQGGEVSQESAASGTRMREIAGKTTRYPGRKCATANVPSRKYGASKSVSPRSPKSPPAFPPSGRSRDPGRGEATPCFLLATAVLQKLGLDGVSAGRGFVRMIELLCEAVPDAQADDFAAVLGNISLSGARDPVAVLTLRGRDLGDELTVQVQSRRTAALQRDWVTQFDRFLEEGLEIAEAMRRANLAVDLKEVR